MSIIEFMMGITPYLLTIFITGNKICPQLASIILDPDDDHAYICKGHHTPGNLVAATSCRQPKLLGDC